MITTILRNGYSNDGIGEYNKKIIFLPYSLPDDKIEFEIIEDKKSFYRGKIKKIINKSPLRKEPLCPHFEKCGNCTYLNTDYEGELSIKNNVFNSIFSKINIKINPIIHSKERFFSRNHYQFFPTTDNKAGFRNFHSHKAFFPDKCKILTKNIFCILSEINNLNLKFSKIHLRIDNSGINLIIHTDKENLKWKKIPSANSIILIIKNRKILLKGNLNMELTVKNKIFTTSLCSFFQVNNNVSELIVNYINNNSTNHSETLLDLYCGCGFFSAFMKIKYKTINGLDNNEESIKFARINTGNSPNINFYKENLEKSNFIDQFFNTQTDCIVDPPRRGIEGNKLWDLFSKLKTDSKIYYISCNPMTQLRDIKRLESIGYKLQEIQGFDMFPLTFHIESVAIFQKI